LRGKEKLSLLLGIRQWSIIQSSVSLILRFYGAHLALLVMLGHFVHCSLSSYCSVLLKMAFGIKFWILC